MERSEAGKILVRVKAAWPKQPVDDAVLAIWSETLSGVPFEVAEIALVELVQTDRKDPPTPGQLYEHTLRVFGRKNDERRAAVRALPEPERSPADIDAVRKLFDDYFDRNPGPAAADRRERLKR